MSCMARRALTLSAVLPIALLTVACADRQDTTAPASPADAASVSASGAQIERSDFPFGFLGGGDPRDNLAFFVGPLDPVAAVASSVPTRAS